VTREPLSRRLGRAAALVATACVLLATSVYEPGTPALDAETSCGPAGRILLEDEPGCGGDPTIDVIGGPEAGLPRYAEATSRRPYDLVLAGEVTIPGSVPAVTVHRVCRVSPAVDGVRTIVCEGEAPEAACAGTLSDVTEAP
jgi:hypothetical protein